MPPPDPNAAAGGRVIRADLVSLKLRCVAMLDYSRGEHGRMYEVHGQPRLRVLERFRSRGPESRARTYIVDGRPVETLDEAVALLNGEALPSKEEPVAKPVSLAQQIEELERERDRRKAVGARARQQSLEEYQLARLEAAIATLRWLQANERTIKQRMAQ